MKGWACILALVATLFGCADSKSTREKPLYYVMIPPQAGLLKPIVGEQAEVKTLIAANQSPHTFEPTARQLAAVGEADALFTLGVPFETALVKKIEPLYPELKIVRIFNEFDLRTSHHDHDVGGCDHDHGEKDPHIWLSPMKAAFIAGKMSELLHESDPKNYWEHYRARYEEQNARLMRLNEKIVLRHVPHRGSEFYVYHPSFGYYAALYGLKQVAIELDGKAPSPRQLADLIERAQADGVKVLFVQEQFPADSAKAIADAIGGSVVPLNPLEEDVIANLERISESIASALDP